MPQSLFSYLDSYDALYQLTGVNATSTAKILAPRYDASYSQTFDFDDNGNIETKTSTSQCNMQTSRVNDLNYEIESVYDPAYAHRVVNSGDVYYQYDANGNLILEHQGLIPEEGPQEMRTVEQFDNAYGTDYGFAIVEKPAGGTYCGTSYREFTWNERNLMRTSRDSRYRVDYRYGADGQRAIKQSSKSETLYYNSMWQLKSNYGPKMRQSKHIYVGETRFVTKCSIRDDDDNVSYESQNIYYYHADHLGSTELVTNVDGLIYERIEYTPYGELWIEEKGSEPTPFRFTGKELDEETGLYYYGARYLDPKYSRWLSADPALGEYIPGAPVNEDARKRNSNLPGMGGVFNTINLHLYHYAGNNPVKYIDPDGKFVYPGGSFDLATRNRQAKTKTETVTQNSGLLANRVLMGKDGIPASGPCLFMSYLAIAETYAGKPLTLKQVKKLMGNSLLYTKAGGAGPGADVIRAALKELNVDISALDIRVDSTIEKKDYRVNPEAFGTVREVALQDGTRGHWQAGTKTGGFAHDPVDGDVDTGREVFAYRNVFINKKEQE